MSDQTKICTECGLDMPAAARVCSHCGNRELKRLSERLGGNWLIATVLGAVLTTCIGLGINHLVSSKSAAAPAVVSTSAKQDAPVPTPAQQVAACEKAHTMSQSRVVRTSGDLTTYRRCVWPAGRYDDPDGYSTVSVQEAAVDGFSEADGTTEASYIDLGAECPAALIRFVFGSQGESHTSAPVHVVKGAEVLDDGIAADSVVTRALPRYPTVNEAVVFHNDNEALEDARCDEG